MGISVAELEAATAAVKAVSEGVPRLTWEVDGVGAGARVVGRRASLINPLFGRVELFFLVGLPITFSIVLVGSIWRDPTPDAWEAFSVQSTVDAVNAALDEVKG